MAYYKLASQNRHDLIVDEVIFEGENGERKSVSTGTPVELSEDEANAVREQGYQIVEAEEPQQGSGPRVGSDVAGMSPVIGESGSGQPAISQTGMEQVQNPPATPADETDQNPETHNEHLS